MVIAYIYYLPETIPTKITRKKIEVATNEIDKPAAAKIPPTIPHLKAPYFVTIIPEIQPENKR